MTEEDDAPVHVRTFLIADIRGFTRFTQERGDEPAARLAASFAALTDEVVASRDGRLLEVRGDEVLAVFTSTRQALRAAIELQRRVGERPADDPDGPLAIGIGIDAGEAVPVGDGYRGGALNMAARLCGIAAPGEILATDVVTHLARTIDGIVYVDRGPQRFKGLEGRVRVVAVHPAGGELVPAATSTPEWLPARVADSERPRSPIEDAANEFAARLNERVHGALSRQLDRMLADTPKEIAPTSATPLPAPAKPRPASDDRVVAIAGVIVGGIITVVLILAVVYVIVHA